MPGVTPLRHARLPNREGHRHADFQGHRGFRVHRSLRVTEVSGHEPNRPGTPTSSPRAGSPSTATAARCATPTPATTASSASSSSASPRTPWSSTPTRRGPCACSSAPGSCRRCASAPGRAEHRRALGPAPTAGAGRGAVKRHLLVTNDFPPKVGGIQNYLWDLWSRLDPSSFVVLTASSDAARRRLRRRAGRARHPHRAGARQASSSSPRPPRSPPCVPRVEEHEIDLVLLDPALPLGLLGPASRRPLRRDPARRRGDGARPPARLAGRARPGVCAARGSSCRPAATRRPRPAASRRTSRRRWSRSRPASTPAPSSPSRRPSAGRRGPGSGCPCRGRCSPASAAWSRARAWTCSSRRPTASPLRTRTWWSPSPVTDGSWSACGAWPSESPVTVEVLGRVSEEDRAALLGASDVFVMACRNRWLGPGAGGLRDRLPRGRRGRRAPGGRGQRWSIRGRARRGDGPGGRQPGRSRCRGRGPAQPPGRPRPASQMGRAARSRVQETFDNDVLASRLADALAGVAI